MGFLVIQETDTCIDGNSFTIICQCDIDTHDTLQNILENLINATQNNNNGETIIGNS
jgi:hypothetical protein